MFNFKTKYKDQELTPKQYELVNALDRLFFENSDSPIQAESPVIKMWTIPFYSQMLPVSMIVNNLKNNIKFEAYIPRSIAIINSGSDMIIFAKIWTNKSLTEQDTIMNTMFSDLVSRTNQARSNYENNQV